MSWNKILLAHIGFDGPRAITLNLFFILFLLLVLPTNTLEAAPKISVTAKLGPLLYPGDCPTQGFFKDCCPSCGITRGASSILHGDLQRALNYNPISVPATIALLAVFFWNAYLWRKESKQT